VTGDAVTTAIIDDEPLARRALKAILESVGWLTCVGEAASLDEGVTLLREQQPELVFLDVALPGGTGLELLQRASSDPVVIFATAFDQYALAAFELGAIDYVTKPFGPERVHRALARATAQLEMRRRLAQSMTRGSVSSLGVRLETVAIKPIETIFVRDRGSIVPVRVRDIVRLAADGDFVGVFTDRRRFLVYVNLGDLATQLDPSMFLRIHRSHIVNLGAIDSIRTSDPNRVEVLMRDGSRITASRAGTRLLRSRIRG
jgi:two-component system, LytTR family, response regulator